MPSRIRIAVDAMGGDLGPSVVVNACISAVSKHPRLEIRLFGSKKDVIPLLSEKYLNSDRLTVVDCDEVISMDDKPSAVLRGKKESSMRKAIEAHSQGDVDGVISGGNTGALMAIGRLVLGTVPAVDRPAICTGVPTKTGFSYLLDMGANVDCSSEQLVQFAHLGSALAKAVEHKSKPSVRLLNIGKEDNKGSEAVKAAAITLTASMDGYGGFIEADEIFNGAADVIVCDGFSGNVALKSSEGVARFIAGLGAQEFNQSWWAKLLGFAAKPLIKRVLAKIDPANYNGAFFVGLNGVLVKSHGDSGAGGFAVAIDKTVAAIEKNMIGLIQDELDLVG